MGGGRYEVLMEEQPPFFFIGYTQAYQWTYQGEKTLLMPGFLRAEHLTFGEKTSGIQTRRGTPTCGGTEAVPKASHPYGKRLFYLDA